MTPHPNYASIRDLTRGILDIGEAVTGTSREYLAAFAGAAAWHAVAVLEREAGEPLESALGELQDQALVVAETLDELGDQATRAALVRAVVAVVRLLASVAVPTIP